jgi:Uncharacterized conserved protein
MKDIVIKTEKIQLDQFLKWADIVESGGQAGLLIADKKVIVNGDICTVKRKQLVTGDVIVIKGNGKYRLVGAK